LRSREWDLGGEFMGNREMKRNDFSRKK